jgi:hypothetical protein
VNGEQSCAVIHTAPSVTAMLPLPAAGPRTRTTLLLAGSLAGASSVPVRTHTASAPTATSPPRMGPADTRTVATTVSVSGSIRDTVPSSLTVSAKSGKGRASMDCTSSVTMSSPGGKDGADMAARMAGETAPGSGSAHHRVADALRAA